MMTFRIVLGSVLLTSLFHGVAWACSCAETGSLEDSLAESDLVVYGEVISTKVRRRGLGCTMSSLDPMDVEIEVIEAFEGAEDGEVVTVTTASSGASCGVDFGEGERWLVFAAGEDLSVGLCG